MYFKCLNIEENDIIDSQKKKKHIILHLILKGAACAWSTSRLDQVPYPPHIDLKISSKLHMLHADDNLSSI
jgi:hypothetical protein